MKIPELTPQQLEAMMDAAPCVRIKTLKAIHEAIWKFAPTDWLLEAAPILTHAPAVTAAAGIQAEEDAEMTPHAILNGRCVYRGFEITRYGDGYTWRDVLETCVRAMSGRAPTYAAAVRAVDAALLQAACKIADTPVDPHTSTDAEIAAQTKRETADMESRDE